MTVCRILALAGLTSEGVLRGAAREKKSKKKCVAVFIKTDITYRVYGRNANAARGLAAAPAVHAAAASTLSRFINLNNTTVTTEAL